MVKTSSIKFLHPLLPIVLGAVFTLCISLLWYLILLKSNTVAFDTYQSSHEEMFLTYISNIEEFNSNISNANKITNVKEFRKAYLNLQADWETISNHLNQITTLDNSENKKLLPKWAKDVIGNNFSIIGYERAKLDNVKTRIDNKLLYTNIYLDISDIYTAFAKISTTKRDAKSQASINTCESLLNTLKTNSVFNTLFYSKEYVAKLSSYLLTEKEYQQGSTRYSANTLLKLKNGIYQIQGEIIKEIEREINR